MDTTLDSSLSPVSPLEIPTDSVFKYVFNLVTCHFHTTAQSTFLSLVITNSPSLCLSLTVKERGKYTHYVLWQIRLEALQPAR